MPTRSGLKITCLAKVGLRLISGFFPPHPTEVALHSPSFSHFPWFFRTPEQGKQKKRPSQARGEQDTSQTLQRDLKQRVQRHPRVTYRIVHQLVKVLFKVVRGSCSQVCILLYVRRHPGRLMEGEDFVDFC